MAQSSKTYSSCNITTKKSGATWLHSFIAKGKSFQLVRSLSANEEEAFPKVKYDKTWRDTFQTNLNIGLLPASEVFFRILELPTNDTSEITEMLELQLEQVSPLPPAQIFWTYEVIGSSSNATAKQSTTVLVIIAEQKIVYNFIGDLQSRNFYTDRISVENIHQVTSAPQESDIIRLISSDSTDDHECLIQWWIEGELKGISQVSSDSEEQLISQVTQDIRQTFWSGQMEGWIDSLPPVEVQCKVENQSIWNELKTSLELESLRFSEGITPEESLIQSATHFGRGTLLSDLLPEDIRKANSTRQFDSLWMSALGCAVVLYLIGLAAYFVFLNQAKAGLADVDRQIKNISVTYTNALKLDERIRITEEQLKLRYAALETWQKVVESLPAELTFKQFKFTKRETLTLVGSGPRGGNSKVDEYVDYLSATADGDGNQIFERVERKNIQNVRNTMSWTIECYFPE